MGMEFKPEIKQDNFTDQYRFRSRSIATLYYKSFFFAFVQVFVFQYINYQYLTLFNKPTILQTTSDAPLTKDDESVVELLQKNYKTFIFYCNIGLILAISSILHVISYQVFNLINNKRMMPFDKWSLIDLIAAVVNLVVLLAIQLNLRCFNSD